MDYRETAEVAFGLTWVRLYAHVSFFDDHVHYCIAQRGRARSRTICRWQYVAREHSRMGCGGYEKTTVMISFRLP